LCENTAVHEGAACANGRGGCYGGLCNFVPLVVSTGPKETVFDWTVDRCDAGATPDGPPQAVRTADGDLVLFSGNPWLIRGPDFDHLVSDCTGPALESAMLPMPQSYENGEWLWSPYREGASWHVLIHNEFHDAVAPTCDPGNSFPGNPCWYNSITYAVSNDDAHSFVKPGAPAHVIAPPPSQWVAPLPDLPRGGYMEGHFMPSSIVRGLDGYYYALMLAIPSYLTGASGVCAMRTQTLGDPTSWRAWDGTAFNLRMESPYVTEVTSPACQLLPRPPGRSWSLLLTHNLTYNTYVQRYMLLTDGDPVGGQRECGIYASLSTDLVHWSDTQLVVQADSLSAGSCYLDPQGPDPIEPVGIYVHYPSIIDHADSTINFDRPGRTSYLYYTRAKDWPGPDRDIVRVPLTFTMIGGPLCEGVNCDDQNACTEDICIGADGSCEHTPIGCAPDFNDCTGDTCDPAVGCAVADGTPCAGGTCQGGVCELTGSVLPCSEQGIRNAIAAGGPHTFDCAEPTRVVTKAEIVVDNDVFLDGEGRLIVDGNADHRLFSVELGADVVLWRITVTGGSTSDEGGGIVNAGRLTLVDSTISGNSATSSGGLRNLGPGTLILANTTLSENTAARFGGGMHNFGRAELIDTTVSNNTAGSGSGAISNRPGATMSITSSTVVGNSTPGGSAGIGNQGTLTVTNSTVSGNAAGSSAGGIGNGAPGVLTLVSTTVARNSATEPGTAIFNDGTATLRNTLIEGDCRVEEPLTSLGGNIESEGNTCGLGHPTDQVSVLAPVLLLDSLKDNGGPTMTHALLPGSVVIDVPGAMCIDAHGQPLTIDQRGELRPAGPGCDVGAYELQP